jgi:hypothetical protein
MPEDRSDERVESRGSRWRPKIERLLLVGTLPAIENLGQDGEVGADPADLIAAPGQPAVPRLHETPHQALHLQHIGQDEFALLAEVPPDERLELAADSPPLAGG